MWVKGEGRRREMIKRETCNGERRRKLESGKEKEKTRIRGRERER